MSRRRELTQTMNGQRAVNINEMIRSDYLRWAGNSWTTTWFDWVDRPVVELTFTYGGDRNLSVVNSSGGVQVVRVIHKRCGPGWRQHFQCPIPDCGRCVDVLFVANFRDHENGLGCRHCLEFVYGPRANRRMMNLRDRHGFGPDALRPIVRPKGMHWKTYWRLHDKLTGLTDRWMQSVPTFRAILSRTAADKAHCAQAIEIVTAMLKSLPGQTPENADAIFAAYDAFYKRFEGVLTWAQRDRLCAAFPSPPPDPPRITGGVGSQRRYRPPRPASRRRKSAPSRGRTGGLIL